MKALAFCDASDLAHPSVLTGAVTHIHNFPPSSQTLLYLSHSLIPQHPQTLYSLKGQEARASVLSD
jgi:hypothetical protein